MSSIESRYPELSEFFETTLWSDAERANLIALLVRLGWFAHPERVDALRQERRELDGDDGISTEVLAELFNREPVEKDAVVTPENVRAFCYSMAETLDFIVDLREGRVEGRGTPLLPGSMIARS